MERSDYLTLVTSFYPDLLNTNNIFRSDVKSRFQAGPLTVIYYFRDDFYCLTLTSQLSPQTRL
jgi:hypothetical protein